MQIDISNEVEEKIKAMTKETGFDFREVVEKAIMSFYLESMKNEIELKKELDAWEILSDEACKNFEKNL
ncbi:MAG: hypothetical protein ABFQ65_00480 [Nanoarchaeota archaeon]